MSKTRQALCSVIVCYSCFTMSLMYAWPSSTIDLFASVNTTLNRPMDANEIALFGSFSSLSAILTTPLSGFLLDRVGRKNTVILFSLPQVVAWLIVSVSRRVEAVLGAMFVSGFGGSVLLLAPVLVSEFCEGSVRGVMASVSMVAYGVGMLVSYLVGGCLDYGAGVYVFLTMASAGVLMLWPLKESPLHLMRMGLEEEAMEAVAFYRRVDRSSEEVKEEVRAARRVLLAEAGAASA